MPKGDYLGLLLRSPKTIYTLRDASLLWRDESAESARSKLHYFCKKGDLIRVRRGVYAKDEEYNRLELATRIFTPSYISFETVLAKEGLIFQFQTSITVAAYLSRTLQIDKQAYHFYKIKDEVLLQPAGVQHREESSIATKERAVLDTLYRSPHFHFDNLRSLNWDMVQYLLPFYNNARLTREVDALYKTTQNDT